MQGSFESKSIVLTPKQLAPMTANTLSIELVLDWRRLADRVWINTLF